MFEFKLSEVAIVFATILGPVLAVQTQKFIERATERRRMRAWIFYTLMTTRATRLTPEHVQALNAIELQFGQSRRWFGVAKRDQAVVDAYRQYFDKLCEKIREEEGRLWLSGTTSATNCLSGSCSAYQRRWGTSSTKFS
jgi:hypothetical protein